MTTVEGLDCHFRINSLEFDPVAGRLFDRAVGQESFLRPQSAHVLQILCENHGQIVTRDALIESVWPELNVTDDSLTQCISDIRRALGDRNRSLLKTVPKRGFVLRERDDSYQDIRPEPPPDTAPSSVADPAPVGSLSENVVVCAIPTPASGSFTRDKLLRALGKRQAADAKMAGSQGYTVTVSGVRQALRSVLHLCRVHSLQAGIDLARFGTPVAAGLACMAAPGQVIVPVEVRDAALLDPELDFEDLGDLAITGQSQARRVFRLHHRDSFSLIRGLVHDDDVLPALAVLPIGPLDRKDKDDVLGDVVAAELTSAFARAADVTVISRLSCAAFRVGKAQIDDVARLLHADFVVSGVYLPSEGGMDLMLELADTHSHRILWTERFNIRQPDLFNGFDLAAEIVGQIRKAITLSQIKCVQTRPLETLRNFTMLYGAVGLMHRLSPSDFTRAKALLEDLAQRAPVHPAPRAWLARWYVMRVMQGWSEDAMADASTALEHASQALDFDPENTHALTATGFVLTNLLRRFDQAEDSYDAALEIDPNDATGRALRGMLFAFQDRGEEGVRDTERALNIAPLDPHRFFYLALSAGANLTAGNYDRALDLTRASLRQNRTHTSTLRMLVALNKLTGKDADAHAAVTELMRLQPDLRVSQWLASSPSAEFSVGRRVADALRDAGVPE
ncbi:MAG: winged helix-turn-helix domain-containing protein [Pseudomonadota bacterium]